MARQTVIVIDDSPAIQALVKARLRDEPIEIAFADTGAAGLALAARLKPDLILLDVDIPEPDGFEVCRRLKTETATRDVPVIFLTGAASAEQKLRGLELGAVDYIVKPFDPADLRARVRAALRTKGLMDLLSEKAAVLQAGEEQWRFLAENSSDVISRHDLTGRFLYVSPSCRWVLGYAPAELEGLALDAVVHSADAAAVQHWLASATTPGPHPGEAQTDVQRLTLRARRKDGQLVWLELMSRTVRCPTTGRPLGIQASSRDVTPRRQAESLEAGRARVLEMVAENQPFDSVLECALAVIEEQYPDSLASVALLVDGEIRYVAPHLSEDFREALRRQKLSFTYAICSDANASDGLLCCDIAADPHWADVRDEAARHGLAGSWSQVVNGPTNDTLGVLTLYHRTHITPDARAQELLRAVAKLITLASSNLELTHQLEYRAHHDPLTGLPNRLLFEDRLTRAIAEANKGQHLVALAYVDLDRFKQINDTFGHQAGDMLLVEFTRRVAGLLRRSDTLARIGGDEFAIILPTVADRAEAASVFQRVIEMLATPFEVAAQEVHVTGSFGMVVYPGDGAGVVELQQNADLTMYRAKALGRNRLHLFTPDLLADRAGRQGLENRLYRAADNGELELHYQPQFDRSGRLCGTEALLRWKHPQIGYVPPSTFIPLAEEAGLIVSIGEWVLRQACRQVRQWIAAGKSPVKVAVNVSALQFACGDFTETVRAALNSQGLAPSWLGLEITESLLMKNPQDSAVILRKLRDAGVSLALDDFGTGYSSLAYLHRLPIDELKIDRSFVLGIGSAQTAKDSSARETTVIDPVSGLTIVRAITSLGHELGMDVVAEGVENAAQRDALMEMGVDVFQGYLLGRPQPAEKLEQLLPPLPADAAAKAG